MTEIVGYQQKQVTFAFCFMGFRGTEGKQNWEVKEHIICGGEERNKNRHRSFPFWVRLRQWLTIVSVSLGRPNKAPQTGGLETTGTVLEAGSLESRCQQGPASIWSTRENLPSPLPSVCWFPGLFSAQGRAAAWHQPLPPPSHSVPSVRLCLRTTVLL